MSLKDKVIRKVGEKINKLKVGNDDYLIVSFPKAGSTWLRFLIANLYNFKNNVYKEVDFHNVHKIVPDLDMQVEQVKFEGLPNIYSTHTPHQYNFKNCILLLRDPLDLMYSYYHYMNGLMEQKVKMDELLKSNKKGISALIRHTNSFVQNCDNLVIITYEMMHKEPEKVMRKLTNFMQLEASESDLKQSIINSSFDSMRNVEERKGLQFDASDQKFTRSGKVGEGHQHIADALKAYTRNELKKSPVLDYIYN